MPLTRSPKQKVIEPSYERERVAKKFYQRFNQEYRVFHAGVEGIADSHDHAWYTSFLLNRLMLLAFLQYQGFLADNSDYLWQHFKARQYQAKQGAVASFYRAFLLPLCHEGLSERERSAAFVDEFGAIPYLHCELFKLHPLEQQYPSIHIADSVFERLLSFFRMYDWVLDESSALSHESITPDMLGYVFEQLINQKEKGAYYTKEDVTEYICKNTIIPALLDTVAQKCPSAFSPFGLVWSRLRSHPERYLSPSLAKGITSPLPDEIAVGLHDISQRTAWNQLAAPEYTVAAETWREVIDRCTHYAEVLTRLLTGEVTNVQNCITCHLDLLTLALDVIASCSIQEADFLLAFYQSLATLTILDPTCGSGAFLLAALQILKPLYTACLTQMQTILDAHDQHASAQGSEASCLTPFCSILQDINLSHNRDYAILRTIIAKNLYGVDIMADAIETCKLRLLLQLLTTIKPVDGIEFLSDVSFHITVGNALLGYTSLSEACVSSPVAHTIITEIEQQLTLLTDRDCLDELRTALNMAQAVASGVIDAGCDSQSARELNESHRQLEQGPGQSYQEWLKSHQPLHWCVEFYHIIRQGGFDVIVGNPPYVEYVADRFSYSLDKYQTMPCANLYPYVVERSHQLLSSQGYHGMILSLAAFATRNMRPLLEHFYTWYPRSWVSFYHFRPSMLFSGGGKVASIPTAIFLACASGKEQRYSTRLLKWATEERAELFSRLVYCPVTTARDMENRHYYPKFGHRLENMMLEKVLSHPCIGQFLSTSANQNAMYYRSAGGLYWKVFVNFPWPYKTTSNKQCYFQERYQRDVFVALLNSSLFWWYYTITFDTFNLKDYMLFGFRFSYPDDAELVAQLCAACQRLMDDFRAHAQHLMRGMTGSYTIYARKSKAIIDEIDCLLAQVYGFTDEELDFILNYDVRYRVKNLVPFYGTGPHAAFSMDKERGEQGCDISFLVAKARGLLTR
jgi:hypothetical protein